MYICPSCKEYSANYMEATGTAHNYVNGKCTICNAEQDKEMERTETCDKCQHEEWVLDTVQLVMKF